MPFASVVLQNYLEPVLEQEFSILHLAVSFQSTIFIIIIKKTKKQEGGHEASWKLKVHLLQKCYHLLQMVKQQIKYQVFCSAIFYEVHSLDHQECWFSKAEGDLQQIFIVQHEI